MRKIQNKSIRNVIKINFILNTFVIKELIFYYYHKLQNIKCKYKDPKISVVFYKIKVQQNKYSDLLTPNIRIQLDNVNYFSLGLDPNNLVNQKKSI